jgi:hypothetical protein
MVRAILTLGAENVKEDDAEPALTEEEMAHEPPGTNIWARCCSSFLSFCDENTRSKSGLELIEYDVVDKGDPIDGDSGASGDNAGVTRVLLFPAVSSYSSNSSKCVRPPLPPILLRENLLLC